MIDAMSESHLHVDRIDHVEMFVPDVYEAARWYERVLGLEIVPGFEEWAAGGDGPLMISPDGGDTKLALFRGTPQAAQPPVGLRRLAFRVGGAAFVRFVQNVATIELQNHAGRRVTSNDVVDHGKAFSIYFTDPWGNRLELTTYDVAPVRAALQQ
jgi:catechol 2,3-dioxygenase-like lactoylglutathione lyase family enzyme